MKEKKCPKCGQMTLSIAEICGCGYNFILHGMESTDRSVDNRTKKSGLLENASSHILMVLAFLILLSFYLVYDGLSFYQNNNIYIAYFKFSVAGAILISVIGLFRLQKWAYFASFGLVTLSCISNIIYLINIKTFHASLLFPIFALFSLVFGKNIFINKDKI